MKHDAAQALLSSLVEAEMFPGIARDDLDFLTKHGELRVFPEGSQLTRQGDLNSSLYIIMEGCVRVERFHPDVAEAVELAILGPGEVVVGAEVLGGRLASTSVTAIEDTETLELDVRALAQAAQKYPDLLAVLLYALSHCTLSAGEGTEPTSASLDKTSQSGRDADRRDVHETQTVDYDLTNDDEAARARVAAGP